MSIRDWLILSSAAGLHPGNISGLLQKFGGTSNLTQTRRGDLIAAGLSAAAVKQITEPDTNTLEDSETWLEDDRHHALCWSDDRYPALLREVPNAPLLLFVKGNPDALGLPMFAIVGSRNATAGAQATARSFGRHLAGSGFCITSGLATGIDAAAHQGALDADGKTVAVCATGLDEIYPARHAALAAAIAEKGALVSEFPPGTPPRRHRFPRRNRIISGLSVGTLVVEASTRSGALITARLAAEQGREVFAIPGSIHNPLARGCHQLIRGGAALVETAQDIVNELPGALAGIAAPVEQNEVGTAAEGVWRSPEYQRLLGLMGWDPVSVNTLVKRAGLTPEVVSSMLLLLELEDRVDPLTGGRYQQREEGRQNE